MRTRTCLHCREEKEIGEFYFAAARGKRHVYCKSCKIAYNKRHYRENKQRYIDLVMQKKRERLPDNRSNLWKYLLANPCIDCGETDLIVLEFDHLDPLTKTANISEMMSSYTWKRIRKEIDKCEVRCANCHRIKTAHQFGWYTVTMGVLPTSPVPVAQMDRAAAS